MHKRRSSRNRFNPYIGKDSGTFCGTNRRYHKIVPLSRGKIGKARQNSVNRRESGGRGRVLGRFTLHKPGVDRKTGFPPPFFFGAPFLRGDGKSPRSRSGGTGAKRHAGRGIISASRPGPLRTAPLPAFRGWCPCRYGRTRCPSSGPNPAAFRRIHHRTARCGARRRR